MRPLVAAGFALFTVVGGVEAQIPAQPDSTMELRSETRVRVRIATRGGAWHLGMIGRWIPSQCVFVLAAQGEDERGGLGGFGTPWLEAIEVWRQLPTQPPDAEPDVTDARQWAP